VTVHQQRWAYCRGGLVGAQDGHLWSEISKTSVSELEWKRVGLVSERPVASTAL